MSHLHQPAPRETANIMVLAELIPVHHHSLNAMLQVLQFLEDHDEPSFIAGFYRGPYGNSPKARSNTTFNFSGTSRESVLGDTKRPCQGSMCEYLVASAGVTVPNTAAADEDQALTTKARGFSCHSGCSASSPFP